MIVLKCFAIYILHITEEIYQGYFAGHVEAISIHKALIGPVSYTGGISEEDRKIGETAVKIISELRKYKSGNNLSLKENIGSVTFILDTDTDLKDALEDIKATCSCREIKLIRGENFGISEIQA